MSRPTTSNCDGLPEPTSNFSDHEAPLESGAGPAPVTSVPLPTRARRPLYLLAGLLTAGVLAGVGYWQWDRYRAQRAWDDAQQALAARDLTAAATFLDDYVARRPKDPAGWFQADRCARRRGKFPEAKRHLAECENRGGDESSIRLERDLILVQQGVIGEADVRLRATVNPDHPDVRLVLEALARGYILSERWADARQACELWRALEPDAPWAWLWGGGVSERMVQIEQAAEFYQRAFELAPDDRDVRIAVARIQVRQRNPGAAGPNYEWVLARDPDDTEALLGLAQCRIEGGQAKEALPLIERARSREPNSTLALSLLGKAAMESGDPAGAETWLRQVVKAEPSDSEALYQLTLALRAQRKVEEAAQLARRLETLQQDLRRLTELTRLIGPQLADAGPCIEAGVISLRIGRTQQGLNLLQDALRRKGDHRPVHAALANHYRQTGRLDLAEVHQSRAEKR